MLEVFDRKLKRTAVLESAFDRVEARVLNGVGTYTFSLPGDDGKAGACVPFGFVRDGGGDYYRLLADGGTAADTGERTFEAEHGIATLVDDVMFGTHLLGGAGMGTRRVMEAILARQTVKHWRLGACEFDKQFEYGFESENLLNALFSVPNLFVEPYRFEFDMRAYPWTVSLRRMDTAGKPQFFIRAGRNLIASRASRTGAEVCTRLYLLGYGEGDNQLTISSVNGGVPYLQSPPDIVARYGLISKVYVDRQFEDAASLMERGRAILAAMQEPRYRRTFKVADLYAITRQDYDAARVGDVVRLCEDGTATYITGVRRRLDVDGDMTLELSTTPGDIAADIADLADRQRIEQVYSQGATQIYAQSVQTNATTTTPAVLNFYIPREMRIINKVVAKISLDRFRSYSQVTGGGGRATTTSSAGGGTTATSNYGGASTQTTSSDGETVVSAAQTVTLDSGVGFTTDAGSLAVTGDVHPSYGQVTGGSNGRTGSASASNTGSAGGAQGGRATGTTGSASASSTGTASGTGVHSHSNLHTHGLNSHTHGGTVHTHSMLHDHGLNMHTHPIGGHRHSIAHTHTMWHQHRIPGHSHAVARHAHRVSIPQHRHDVTVRAHQHNVSIPDHTHVITQGIFRFGNPQRARIMIGNVQRAEMGRDTEIDLTEHLLGANGKIPRGSWIKLGVLPDDNAYVTIDIVVQGFVQSRGGISA